MTAFGPDLPRLAELAPGVLRLLAPNQSMMTGPGTNTYLFGTTEIAVVDPGPNLKEHIERIEQIAGGPIRWILVTHTHPDHSPAAMPLAKRTGAEVLGIPAPQGEQQDMTFSPDRVLADGDVLQTEEFRLEAIHTPRPRLEPPLLPACRNQLARNRRPGYRRFDRGHQPAGRRHEGLHRILAPAESHEP